MVGRGSLWSAPNLSTFFKIIGDICKVQTYYRLEHSCAGRQNAIAEESAVQFAGFFCKNAVICWSGSSKDSEVQFEGIKKLSTMIL